MPIKYGKREVICFGNKIQTYLPISPSAICVTLIIKSPHNLEAVEISAANRDSDGLLCQRQPIGSILISFVP